MRNLASIQTVSNIEPIEGSDFVEKLDVLGWHLVGRKGEFHVGDLCVYIECDSVLPLDNPDFDFLKDANRPEKPIRIKTRRIRQQISQGIAFPLSILEGKRYTNDTRENPVYDFKEGQDVTELLGITKYEPPEKSGGEFRSRGSFPSFIPKTDETRIQSCFHAMLPYIESTAFVVTEKLDGQSFSAWRHNEQLGCASRNLWVEDGDNRFWNIARKYGLHDKIPENVALQGEVCGPGIQQNRLKLEEVSLFIFNGYDIGKQEYWNHIDLMRFCVQNDIPTVPEIGFDEILPTSVDALVAIATRKSALNTDVWAEGIVCRPMQEKTHPRHGRVSWKIVNPEYLLQHGI